MSKQPSIARMLSQLMACDYLPRNVSINQFGWRLSYLPYASDTETDETAIVIDERYFLILDGDHRQALDLKTLDEAKAYWAAHPELHGGTSNKLEDLP